MKTISLDMTISMAEQIKNLPTLKFYIADFCEFPVEIEDSKKNLKNIRKKQYGNLNIFQKRGVKIHLKL